MERPVLASALAPLTLLRLYLASLLGRGVGTPWAASEACMGATAGTGTGTMLEMSLSSSSRRAAAEADSLFGLGHAHTAHRAHERRESQCCTRWFRCAQSLYGVIRLCAVLSLYNAVRVQYSTVRYVEPHLYSPFP